MKNLFLCVALFLATLPLQAASPYHYGQYWESLTKEMRVQYVAGFKDGMASASYHLKGKAYLDQNPKDQKHLRRSEATIQDLTHIHSDQQTLAKVMTDLYKDPANMYVPLSEMLVIAQSKIDGKPVEDMLLQQRKLILEANKMTPGGPSMAMK